MEFVAEAYTDVGIKKETNQDSALIQEADTAAGKAILAVICDGMGGLSKGEVARRNVKDGFKRYFRQC